jgi:predicted nucleic acid-binding protein
MTFVVDTSVAMGWCFEDEANEFSDEILDRLRDSDAVVPASWRLEVANVLLVAERRGRITEAQATRFVELLLRLPIHTEIDVLEVNDVLAAGRRHGLSAYDACYLLVAERRGVPLATLDETLAAAGRSAGVTVWSAD